MTTGGGWRQNVCLNGRLRYWPSSADGIDTTSRLLLTHEFHTLIWGGNSSLVQAAPMWLPAGFLVEVLSAQIGNKPFYKAVVEANASGRLDVNELKLHRKLLTEILGRTRRLRRILCHLGSANFSNSTQQLN